MFADSFDAWLEQNPIAKARLAKEHSVIRAATEVGVSPNAYRKWEVGAAIPNEENIEALKSYTGNAEIGDEIKAWFDSKPKSH